MRVLGIESSGPRGGVALLDAGRVVGTRVFERGMVHGREIAPAIQDLLAEAGFDLNTIDLLACDLGPGSYTGLRVGLAAAKGLALATGIPLAGVPSLDVLAEAAKGRAKLVCPAIDGRCGLIYGALYEDGARKGDFLAEKPDVFAGRVPPGTLVLGDALAAYAALFRDVILAPRELWDLPPELVALLGERLWESGVRQDVATLVPLYLRQTEAEIRFGPAKKD